MAAGAAGDVARVAARVRPADPNPAAARGAVAAADGMDHPPGAPVCECVMILISI